MYKRILSFVYKNKILYPLQYGFQEGKSTELAINAILNKITESLDNKMRRVVLF